MRRTFVQGCVLVAGLVAGAACGKADHGAGVAAPSSSEVAVSVVSGAINTSAGSVVGWNAVPAPRRSVLDRVLHELAPIGRADAATWTCTGGTLSPAYAGPGSDPYAYTPVSCSITWDNAKTGSSDWSGTFTLDYGASCDASHARIVNQTAGCTLTRTTGVSGNTRTITGPLGNAYSIRHDTHGAGTGWDTGVSPAPTDDGVVVTCAEGGCASGGGSLAIAGSHLTGSVTPAGGATLKIWDHTVSTPGGPLTFTVSGGVRVFSGTVTVQHNLARYTAATTFDAVGYGEPGCCFPTTGTATTAFLNGPFEGKTESIAFTGTCGEATLTTASGQTEPITLLHCL